MPVRTTVDFRVADERPFSPSTCAGGGECCNAKEPFRPAACGGGAPGTSARAKRAIGILPLLVACGALLCAGPAMAHKLNVYAEVKGTTISGMAYFHGGSPAQGAKIEAFAPDGRKLGETTTDANGEFTLAAKYRCDVRLVVNAGGGHGAEGKVGADELPKDYVARAEKAFDFNLYLMTPDRDMPRFNDSWRVNVPRSLEPAV